MATADFDGTALPPRVLAAVDEADEVHAEMARRHPAAFASYVLRDEETGRPITMTPAQKEWHRLSQSHSRLMVWSHIESGKGLALDTPIPTPSGWTTMGALRAGDVVFGGDGAPVRVTVATAPVLRDCYRVTFDDGSWLIADDVHRWVVRGGDDGEWEVANTLGLLGNDLTLRKAWQIPGVESACIRKGIRGVSGIEPVPSVPTRCISVESEDHTYLAGEGYIVTHNSTQISIANSLYRLGEDPHRRVVVVSKTHELATKICGVVKGTIERSPQFHKVFPNCVPSKSNPWTQHAGYLERDREIKDPSFQTCGVHGNILGSRIDLLILDDVLTYENTRTQYQRDDLYNWFQSTLEGRVTRNGRILCVGTAWHPDDLMHRFAARSDWFAVRYPVIDDLGRPTWPERWPLDRIEAKRIALGPLEFSRQLLCIAVSDEESRFRREWFAACLRRGEGIDQTWALEAVPPGYGCFTGVDLSVGESDKSDLTCLFTILVHPDGSREVLEIQSGRWDGPTIVDKIVDTHHRFHSIVMVESNAAQQFIVQFTRAQSAVPVKSYATGAHNKFDPDFGVETMGVEMANSKWVIPSVNGAPRDGEIAAWVQECVNYRPGTHTGDRLMASWLAREAARIAVPKVARRFSLDTTAR